MSQCILTLVASLNVRKPESDLGSDQTIHKSMMLPTRAHSPRVVKGTAQGGLAQEIPSPVGAAHCHAVAVHAGKLQT